MANLIKKYIYYLWSIFELLTGFENPLLIIKIFLGSAPPGRQQIRLRHQGLEFEVRSAMDIWSVKETCIDRFYERFGTPVEDNWVVIDIGGGIGEFTILVAKNHSDNKVFAFEPFRESFNLLRANLELNRINNVEAHELAVWGKEGYLRIDTTPGEPSQFISRESDTYAPGEDYTIVPAMSLTEVFTELSLDHCDLLKLDCEGAEYPILLNSPEPVLAKIQRIILEYHDNVTKYTHKDLEIFLTTHGYEVKITPNYVHAYLGYLSGHRVP